MPPERRKAFINKVFSSVTVTSLQRLPPPQKSGINSGAVLAASPPSLEQRAHKTERKALEWPSETRLVRRPVRPNARGAAEEHL
jgi:hypothetical protein